MTRTSAEVQQEITAGETLAKNIKNYFFPNEPWNPKTAWVAGVKMRDIKRKADQLFTDQDMISILHTLNGFSKEDLEELLEM